MSARKGALDSWGEADAAAPHSDGAAIDQKHAPASALRG